MANLMVRMSRDLAPARSIPLYKDQEKALKDINEELVKGGMKLPATTEVVRMGVDLLIEQLRKELGMYEKEI